MTPDWHDQSRLKAHVDRIRFTIEPASPISREEMAAHLPLARRRGERSRSDARWELRSQDEHFAVTIHDLDCIPAMVAIAERLELRMPLKRSPRVTLLEVALDVWPRKPGTIDLERVVADLFKGAKFEPSRNSRAANAKTAVGIKGKDAAYRLLKRGYSLYNGNANDPSMVRAYVKRTDNRRDLPEGQHRARFEVQLQGEEALGELTVRAMTRYNFTRMVPMFLMRTVRDGLPPVGALLAASVPKLRRYPRPRSLRHRRWFMDRAFTEFNRRVYAAFEDLSRSVHSHTRSPFRPDHLAVLRESVRADCDFPRFIAVNPMTVSKDGGETLTTLLPANGEQEQAA